MCDDKVKKNTREDKVDFSCGGKKKSSTDNGQVQLYWVFELRGVNANRLFLELS